MKRGEVKRFAGGSFRTLRCLSGSVWVTAASDLNDYVVGAGETLSFESKGYVVVQCLSEGLKIEITQERSLFNLFRMSSRLLTKRIDYWFKYL